jgi:ribosomal protein S18 acetylase RimI-like enzyme
MTVADGPGNSRNRRMANDAFKRAIETDRVYFEMGAEQLPLSGAVMAWMPGLTHSAAAAVIHRVQADVVSREGPAWVARAEQALADANVTFARIYLDHPHPGAESLLRAAGYVDRDELTFCHQLPAPPAGLVLRRIMTAADWEEKLRFHQSIAATPDGHDNRAVDWVALERRKSMAGMDVFFAEQSGCVVGVVGTIWGDRLVRIKNFVVHPSCRRQHIGTGMLGLIAELGRSRGVSVQCVMAVKGGRGEQLYRAAGMAMIGYQVEWSKWIGGNQ